MAPKGLVVLAILFAAFLSISCHVAAEEQRLPEKNAGQRETNDAVVGDSKIKCRYGCAVSINWICKVCKPKPPQVVEAAEAAADGDGVGENRKAADVGGNKRQLCDCCEYRGRRCLALCCPDGEVVLLRAGAEAKPHN